MVKVFVKIGNHEEELTAFITTLGHHELVLGIPWMRDHDVKLDLADNSLEFTADKSHTTCMKAPTTVYRELPKHSDDLIQISMISATSYHRMTVTGGVQASAPGVTAGARGCWVQGSA